MQIVSLGDTFHEMSMPSFWKKKIRKNIISLLSAELAQGVVMVKRVGQMREFVYQVHLNLPYNMLAPWFEINVLVFLVTDQES